MPHLPRQGVIPLGVFFSVALLCGGARADRLDAIRASHSLSCAAEARPGFAEADEQGKITGLAVDLCRAVAIAVIGPDATVHVSVPEADNEFPPLAQGQADIAFLSRETIAEHGLAATLIPGPTVFIDPQTLMVPVQSPIHEAGDLGGRIVCLMIGTPAQRALEDGLGRMTPPVIRLGFREDVEMIDAYNVGRCDAVADDATRLGEMRGNGGINHLRSRIVLPPLALTPVLTTTPADDGAWASLTGWLVRDIITGTNTNHPGFRPQWHADITAALGTYAAMRERNLGDSSDLKLPVWPNAPWPDGLLGTR